MAEIFRYIYKTDEILNLRARVGWDRTRSKRAILLLLSSEKNSKLYMPRSMITLPEEKLVIQATCVEVGHAEFVVPHASRETLKSRSRRPKRMKLSSCLFSTPTLRRVPRVVLNATRSNELEVSKQAVPGLILDQNERTEILF